MASALGNLMANYTDSEGEEGQGGSDGEGSPEDRMHPSLAERSAGLFQRLGRLGASAGNSPSNGTPASSTSARSGSINGTPVKKAKLVTYDDPDAGLSDEDRSEVPMDLESDADSKDGEEELQQEEIVQSHIMAELWQEGVKLPPEPQGHCSRDLQDKIETAWKRKVEQGVDYNRVIQCKKAFRNPSIYEKLIIHCKIDELGTNFPPHLYDGHLFGKESYYDELAKVQKTEMDKREKALEAKKKDGARLKENQSQQHRKSKWDVATASQGGGVTTKVGTVISAFGSLNKRK